MTPVFRHGRLRLYLLKLLEEAPRHGYEVIRLLQDRFLGVYSPSPGTIYPRLARLEAEGLVTHDESDGKKVYRITDKGRQELKNRIEDLKVLEDELAASARDIAMEIGRDVRDTVRSLREEIGRAARTPGAPRPGAARGSWPRTGSWAAGATWWTAQGHGSPPAQPGASADSRPSSLADLERLATDFVKDVTTAATRARSGMDEAGMRDLRGILADTLGRISTEVFGPGHNAASGQPPRDNAPGQSPRDSQPAEAQQDAPPTG